MWKKLEAKSFFLVLVLFVGAFFLGRFAAQVVPAAATAVWPEADNWGLSFQDEGQPPVANATFEEMAEFNAFYAQNTQEKVLYLTFDCGFENGNTPLILDALKKHNAKAAFFIVGNYLSTSPDLVKRMVEEGHIVGNHSYHHPDMSQMNKDEFSKELGIARSTLQSVLEDGNTTVRRRENTAKTICRLPKTWGIRLFSGVLLMWTGIRTVSPVMKKPLTNC